MEGNIKYKFFKMIAYGIRDMGDLGIIKEETAIRIVRELEDEVYT
jgi:hypothetical protein